MTYNPLATGLGFRIDCCKGLAKQKKTQPSERTTCLADKHKLSSLLGGQTVAGNNFGLLLVVADGVGVILSWYLHSITLAPGKFRVDDSVMVAKTIK